MKYRVVIASVLVAVTTLACGQLADSTVPNRVSAEASPPIQVASLQSPLSSTLSTEEAYPSTAISTELKLIRSGVLVLRVEDVGLAIDRAVTTVESHGGFLSSSQVSQDDDGNRSATLTLRIPSERFGLAVDELKGVGEIDRESTNTQDITKTYFDLDTRLRVKREAEQRLREILRERTGDLSQVLAVEGELTRIVEEIEQIEGERRFYDRQIAMSTLTLEIYDQGAAIGPGLLSPVSDAFADALRVLAQSVAFLVYLVAFLVPWLALTAIIWWVIQLVRRRRGSSEKEHAV